MTHRGPSFLLLLALLTTAACGDAAEPEAMPEPTEANWQPLFDGTSLTGWENPYEWGEAWVEEGEIRMLADRKFFLVTEQPYQDFIFEGEIFMPEGEANSGFMFRANVEPNKVYGYQAEVDPSDRQWSGGLYDEGRRGWLNPDREDSTSVAAFRAQAGDAFRHGEWNRYRIQAEGDHLRIWVNDVLTTDYRDSTDTEGYIGIQHHGEEGKTYRFRNLRIQDLSSAEAQQ
jgi:hypothetical protein